MNTHFNYHFIDCMDSIMKRLCLTFLCLSAMHFSNAQQITISSSSIPIDTLLKSVEEQTSTRFVLSEDDFDYSQEIKLNSKSYQISELIGEISGKMNLTFTLINGYYVVTTSHPSKENNNQILQTIRGQVRDLTTGSTLPSANIYRIGHLENSTISDLDGKFNLKVPVGRVSVAFSFIGYKTVILPLLITTGEEQFLTVELEPTVASLKEVTIEAERDKARTQNELAYASGRSFNVLEANKYAGTLGDPARMARSYAGVLPARDDRNDIIIRGNSPTGIQWRLDDIEIPNPNHYGGIGLTGNTTTLLNMNLLDNSDFLMGAFPTEYGNALSGVFDLHTKKINPTKRQYRFQTGWNGFEFGADGPFSKKKDWGTYSLTYRYSFLDVMRNFGLNMGVLPKFQDLTGKFDFKLNEKTTLSLLGIWGISEIELDDHDLDSAEAPETGEFLKTGSDLSLAGANLTHRINKKLLFKSNISVIDNRVNTEIDTFNLYSDASRRIYTDHSGETKYSAFAQIDYRNNSNLIRIGARWDTYVIDYHSSALRSGGITETIHKENRNLNLARFYVENEHRFTDRFRVRAGIHNQYLLLNGSMAVEPRMALRYLMADYHVFALSYGNHHSLQPRNIYFIETATPTGSVLTNEDLDFSAAHHITLSYDYTITDNLRFKAESYFQYLYDIAVEQKPGSSFSMVNVGSDFFIPQIDSLTNDGLGRNYGLELTLERFFSKGYYFMVNTALFKSEYQNPNDKWRSTAFDMNYSINGVGGYEKWFSQKFALGADIKLTYAGGKPYTPVNETESMLNDEVIFNENLAYESRLPDYFRTDLKIFYRINYKKVYVEFALDLQNITNHQNIYQREFNPRSGEYQSFYHMQFFPMGTFKVQF